MRYSEINHTQNLREKIYYIRQIYHIGGTFSRYNLNITTGEEVMV